MPLCHNERMFFTKKTTFIEMIPNWLKPPHKETQAEKAVHIIQQAILFCLLFLAGYFVAEIQDLL